MKVEEAISRVKIAFGYSTAIHGDWKLDDEAEKIAIEAMKKQEQMKPERLDGFRCRNCFGKLARQTDLVGQKYCHHCGQKLDWTNEDD